MSRYSCGVVENSEQLARFVFSPMHLDKKKEKVKPNFFSHVNSQGCSIQRDAVASIDELVSFTKEFLGDEVKRSWKGVVLANCMLIRGIKVDNTDHRKVCVYDTANKNNPAHAELCRTQYVIDEADQVELRSNLFQAFGNGSFVPTSQYRNGVVWDNLPPTLQSRN